MRKKTKTLHLTAALGLYQLRGDLFAKISLFLVVTQLIISARVMSEFKAVSAVSAETGPKPALKLFIDNNGAIHIGAINGSEATPSDITAALSKLSQDGNGGHVSVAICLPEQNALAQALVNAGLNVAQTATNAETVITLTPSPKNELAHK